jgi:exosortase F-associated protein
MIKERFRNTVRFLLMILLVILIILVRIFENHLFYDPFLVFFKLDYQNRVLPNYDGVQLFFGLLFRYGLNTIFSLGLLFLLFMEKKIVIFSIWLYLIFFIILITIFFSILIFDNNPNYLVLFYIRRFLIQPLFLVLFVPAFYYQKMKNNSLS